MNLYILLCAAFVFLYSRSVQAHIPDLDQDLEVASQQVRTCELQVLRDAGDPAARARLIIAYLTRARLVGDWSDVDQAEAVLARAKTLAPGHPELLWAESSLCAYQHHFRAAWLAAKKLIRACPGDPRGHRAAGDALLELGDIGGAAAHYARLAQLNRDFDTLVRQAYLFQAQGHLDEAVSTLQQAIAAADDPGRRNWARVVLASCETARGELTLAETILREVLQERHNDDFALKHLGQVLVAKGKDEEAADLYGRAFSIRPDPVGAGTWAAVERRLGHHPLADTLDQVAEQALRTYVTSGRVAYLRELATFYLRREKNPEEALRLALQDIGIRRDTRGIEILAWAHEQNRQHLQAWEMIQQALVRPDADAQTWCRAGQIAREMGKEKTARRYWAKAFQLNPSQPEVHQLRALLPGT